MIEDPLLEIRLHLAADAEHEHPRPEPHGAHHGCHGDDQQRLTEHGGEAEALLQAIDDTAHLQGDRHPQQIHHQQRHGPQGHLAAVRAQIAADLAETLGAHAVRRGPLTYAAPAIDGL